MKLLRIETPNGTGGIIINLEQLIDGVVTSDQIELRFTHKGTMNFYKAHYSRVDWGRLLNLLDQNTALIITHDVALQLKTPEEYKLQKELGG